MGPKTQNRRGMDKGLPTYTSVRLINAGLARVPGNVAKLFLYPLVMHGDRDRLRHKVLGGLPAGLDGDRRRRGVSRPDIVNVPGGFRGRSESQAGRRADILIVNKIIQVHGLRLGRNLLRSFAQLRYPTWRVERSAGEAV